MRSGPAPPADSQALEPPFFTPGARVNGSFGTPSPNHSHLDSPRSWEVGEAEAWVLPPYIQGGDRLASLSLRCYGTSFYSTGRPPAQPHHSIVFTFHDVVIHPQDPVPFPKTLVLGGGARLHPAHHRPSPAQLLLQVEAKTPAFLFAQQTETRPLQAPEI